MADFLATLRTMPLLADGAMGSFLFERTGRLSEANHVYEAFNLERPELIRSVHDAYLAAGAQCLKTNTFGANRAALREYGLEARLTQINTAGVTLARQALAVHGRIAGADTSGFVLASIGPPPHPLANRDAVADCYRLQLESLIAAGVDALLLETFHELSLLVWLVELIQTLPGAPPVIAEMSLPSSRSDEPLAPLAQTFYQRMCELGVPVIGVNCCAPWDAVAFVDAVRDEPAVQAGRVLLSAMPNAGGFQRIGNRFLSRVNPEYMGMMARSFRDRGVRLIGGCCEVHPPHIREMHNFLRTRQGARIVLSAPSHPAAAPAGPAEKMGNGPFTRKLFAGQFAVSVELVPPRGTNPQILQARAQFVSRLAASGRVDAVDITDSSRGIPLMPPGDFVHLLREALGWTPATGDRLELIPHFTARDLNLMGVQSRLIGYHASRIHNVLFITGDPPKMSPTYPRSTAVFDLDSVQLIRLVHSSLNAGVDFGGTPLGKHADPRTHFTIGTGFEPEALDLRRELDRLRQKIAHGADYVMTQPAFRPEPLAVLEPFRHQCRFLVGVMVLASLEHAQRMQQVPGVIVPDRVMQRLAAFDAPADQARAAAEIAAAQIRWVIQEGWAGLYLMSPVAPESALAVLEAAWA